MKDEEKSVALTIRPCTDMEAEFAYGQPKAVRLFAGGMGYIRGDFDRTGTGFFTTSFLTDKGYSKPVITQEIRNTITEMIEAMRSNPKTGFPLRDRSSMRRYQGNYPGKPLETPLSGSIETAVRVDDSRGITIILRLKPSRGDYDFYAHCFKTDALDRMLDGRAHGIELRTLATDKLLVHLNHGDSLYVVSKSGEVEITLKPVYLDENHFYARGYSTPGTEGQEYINNMELETLPFTEGNEKTLIPVRKDLPEKCYGVNPETNTVIEIRKSDIHTPGYRPLEGRYENYEASSRAADEMNETLADVTRPEDRRCMEAGAFKGWAHPDADPSTYRTFVPEQDAPHARTVVQISKQEEHTEYEVPFKDNEVEVISYQYDDTFNIRADENGKVTEWIAVNNRGNAVAFGETKEDCADRAVKEGYTPQIGFIRNYYVIEGTQERMFPFRELKEYETLGEAVKAFRELPECGHKLLGVNKRPTRSGGRDGGCDLIGHRPGKAYEAYTDWKIPSYGYGWDNVEIRSVHKTLCKEFGIEEAPKKKKSKKKTR